MKDRLAVAALLFLCVAFSRVLASPQRGTAENGYYPPGYAGDTFSGTVTATEDASRSLTLTYTDPKSKKSESLVAVIAEGYTAHWKDGTSA